MLNFAKRTVTSSTSTRYHSHHYVTLSMAVWSVFEGRVVELLYYVHSLASLHHHSSLSIYIYLSLHVWVCVCVCVGGYALHWFLGTQYNCRRLCLNQSVLCSPHNQAAFSSKSHFPRLPMDGANLDVFKPDLSRTLRIPCRIRHFWFNIISLFLHHFAKKTYLGKVIKASMYLATGTGTTVERSPWG